MKALLTALLLFTATSFATELPYFEVSCKVLSNGDLFKHDPSNSMVVFFNVTVDKGLQHGEATIAYKNGGKTNNQIISIHTEDISKTLQKSKSSSLRFLTQDSAESDSDGFAMYFPKDFTKKQEFKATVSRIDEDNGENEEPGPMESDSDEAICMHTTFIKK